MKVEIWSDIRCPFCYIGKRKFEAGLAQFAQKDKVEVSWHSFELDPKTETNTNVNIHDYLAEIKGKTREWSIQMHEHVTKLAKEVGLNYDFDKTVMANSFNAHRLIQLAKTKGLDNDAEERIFKAYFEEGQNIDDIKTLIRLGTDIGLDPAEIEKMLHSTSFIKEVRDDEEKAQAIGISGVPFFVVNNKHGISGAQAPETFTQALQEAWLEYEKEHPQLINLNSTNGDSCDIEGNCSKTI